MATSLQVTQGPDAGRSFVIEQETVRIGNDSNANVRINDPQLRGVLVIQFRDGVYHVSNQLSSPIWFRMASHREEFAPGEERVWYDGARVQPTALTELLLVSVPDSPVQDAASGLREITEATETSDGIVRTLCILGIAVGLLILLASLDSPAYLTTGRQKKLASEIAAHLQLAPSTTSKQFDSDWDHLASVFRDARFADRAGDVDEAANLYLICSQIQGVLRRQAQNDKSIVLSEEHSSALNKMTTLVNQRKLKLAE